MEQRSAWLEGGANAHGSLRRTGLLALVIGVIALNACSGQESTSAAERGRQVYLVYCTSCHATDPARAGPIAPAVKGSSRELLEARVLRGSYPLGYTPRRNSAVMQPLPQLASSIPDLAAYLR